MKDVRRDMNPCPYCHPEYEGPRTCVTCIQGSVKHRGPWIQTYSGIAFFVHDPRPNEVLIEDIAHSLSMQCRFTGHVSSYYSVGEHCVRMSYMVPPEDALWALLHDGSEAYLTDLAHPLKASMSEYKYFEQKVQAAVCAKFNLTLQMPPTVHHADKLICAIEARDLLGRTEAPLLYGWGKYLSMISEVETMTIHPAETLGPVEAKRQFLARFNELCEPDQFAN